MTSHPAVALIIAAKDAAQTIGRAVASALMQSPVAEVIVIDDGSSDATAAVARGADDQSGRLAIVQLPANVGPAAARNQGLGRARSPVVGVLDADDYLEPGRIETMLAAAPAEWDFLADNLIMKRAGEEALPGGLLIEPDPPAPVRLEAEAFIRGNLQDPARPRRELGFLKPLMRRSFLNRHGLAYDEALRLGEDFVLYAEAMIRGAAFVLVPACGYVAVERVASLSDDHHVSDLAVQVRADRRLLELAVGRADIVRALREHQAATQLKFDYRSALEAKKDGRIVQAFAHTFRTPRTAHYILGQTLRAWADRAAR
jgi:succinoglycan biosynthesis protein ExoU